MCGRRDKEEKRWGVKEGEGGGKSREENRGKKKKERGNSSNKA